MRLVLVALFGAVLGVALWAWVAAPSQRRFVIRFGNPGIDGSVGKGAGLVVWVGLGAVAFVGSLLTERENEGLAAAGAALLAFLLLMEIVSVRRTMR